MIEGALLSLPVINRNGIFFWCLRSVVKVRYTFFLTTVLLGLRAGSLASFGTWLAVVFFAILLHECGHALAARYFGQQPQIELHAMGGVTTWTWVDHLRWWNRVVISLAGPVAGFILGAAVWGVTTVWPPDSFVGYYASHQFLWVCFAWGAFNLLPMLPLDGGQVMCEYLEHRRGRDQGRALARKVSVATGVAGLAVGIAAGEAWAGLLCGIFAFDNYQRMQGLPGVKLPA